MHRALLASAFGLALRDFVFDIDEVVEAQVAHLELLDVDSYQSLRELIRLLQMPHHVELLCADLAALSHPPVDFEVH